MDKEPTSSELSAEAAKRLSDALVAEKEALLDGDISLTSVDPMTGEEVSERIAAIDSALRALNTLATN